MPTAALRFCPKCHGPMGETGCQMCVKLQRKRTDLRRGSRHERGYGTAWDRETARWKATHPFCGMRADRQLHPEHSACARQGIKYAGGYDNPLETDHIVPKEDGGPDSEANYQTLCRRCHSSKTAAENNLGGART